MYPLTPYPLTPLGSFIGFVLSIAPLISHLNFHSRNTGIWMCALWIASMNMINFVDTIVWHNNVNIIIPVWCDIVTKFQSGAAIGLSACNMVLSLHLFRISRMRTAMPLNTKAQRRNTIIYDLALTLGVPIVVMALWIVVQPHRFEIREEIGCQSIADSYAAYVIFYVPQIAFSLTSVAFAPFTIVRFIRHRREMNEILSTDSNMTSRRCMRALTITYVTLLLNLPILAVLVTTLIAGHESNLDRPSQSWSFVRYGWLSKIIQTTAETWGNDKWQVLAVKWNEWIYVVHGIIFFSIFGTTEEARISYRIIAANIWAKIGLRRRVEDPTLTSEITFSSNPHCQRLVTHGTFSFDDSTIVSGDHVALSENSEDLVGQDRAAFKHVEEL
ncbi:STE3-domain-containing protein [Schizopora paradoxa]|uniref:STE3-domain-containing protein n=1 Tax=Schizopora paradoxa TaxID=27342 RepID=A0A0H2RR91_9AGAM|nr:STE3-domain-containing protein [Schizopora paradoxa]